MDEIYTDDDVRHHGTKEIWIEQWKKIDLLKFEVIFSTTNTKLEICMRKFNQMYVKNDFHYFFDHRWRCNRQISFINLKMFKSIEKRLHQNGSHFI